MFSKKTTVICLLLILCSTFLFSGGEQEVVTEEETISEVEGLIKIEYKAWECGKKGGRFVIATNEEPKSLNYFISAEMSTSDIVDRTVTAAFKRNIVTLEYDLNCCEGYEISEDEKTCTVYLRKDLKWSDGVPITAKDFVFGLNHVVLRKDVGSNERDGNLVNDVPIVAKLIDDYTYSITLDTIYADILGAANIVPAPIHVMAPLIGWTEDMGYEYQYHLEDGVIVEENPNELDYGAIRSMWGVGSNPKDIVCSGPFTIDNYVPGQKVVLKANPYYFRKDAKGTRMPYIDELVLLICADTDTMMAKFQAGEVDFYSARGEDVSILLDKPDKNYFMYDAGPAAQTNFLVFNQNPNAEDVPEHVIKWANTKKFRQAMGQIVDRETIINNIAYGFGYAQYSFVPTCSPYFWKEAPERAFKYNLDNARALLDELGWVDTDGDGIREDDEGIKISIRLSTNSGARTREAIGEMLVQEAKKVGVELLYQPQDFNTLVSKLMSGNDWEGIIIGLTGSVDPISGANTFPSRGFLHMIEPLQEKPRREWEKAVDAAWKVANNTTNQEQRRRGFQTIQEIWIDELPWIYTFNPARVFAINKNLGNAMPRAISRYEWDYIAEFVYWK